MRKPRDFRGALSFAWTFANNFGEIVAGKFGAVVDDLADFNGLEFAKGLVIGELPWGTWMLLRDQF